MSQPIRILLADDHVMLRQCTAEILHKEADIEVVGEADDGQQAVELALRLQPDIVVMDVRMPVLSGVEATRRIREAMPEVQVLVLTAYDDDQYISSILQAGASGYLLKTAPVNELMKSIRQFPLNPEHELALYRISQEALANIRRHAHATGVMVELSFGSGVVKLEVVDDGRGFEEPLSLTDFAQNDHFGLLGIQERVGAVGGSLSIRSSPVQGTQLSVTIPVANSDTGN